MRHRGSYLRRRFSALSIIVFPMSERPDNVTDPSGPISEIALVEGGGTPVVITPPPHPHQARPRNPQRASLPARGARPVQALRRTEKAWDKPPDETKRTGPASDRISEAKAATDSGKPAPRSDDGKGRSDLSRSVSTAILLIEFPGEAVRNPTAAIATITEEDGKKIYSLPCPRCKAKSSDQSETIKPTLGEWFHRQCGYRMKFTPLREFAPEKAAPNKTESVLTKPARKTAPKVAASADW